MIKKQTILLTGATGFLGRHILAHLDREKFETVILLRKKSKLENVSRFVDTTNLYYLETTDIDKLFKERHIDIVLHCATNYGRNNQVPLNILDANLILPLKLLQAGLSNGLATFINTDTILDKRINYYSLSKSQFKEWLRMYDKQLACVNIALEHFYGPGDDTSKFVTWLVSEMDRKVDKVDLTMGEQRRDFIYVDDVVDAFIRIINSTHRPGFWHYEIGSGETTSIRELAELVKKLSSNIETKLNFGAVPYRMNEIMESHTNLAAIHALGWKPQIKLADGLKQMIGSKIKS